MTFHPYHFCVSNLTASVKLVAHTHAKNSMNMMWFSEQELWVSATIWSGLERIVHHKQWLVGMRWRGMTVTNKPINRGLHDLWGWCDKSLHMFQINGRIHRIFYNFMKFCVREICHSFLIGQWLSRCANLERKIHDHGHTTMDQSSMRVRVIVLFEEKSKMW